MPFVGMDWRGPGEEWVKGECGEWMKMKGVRRKVLNTLHEKTFYRDRLTTDPSVRKPQAYIIFKKNNVLHPLGEALNDLEMEESVRDQTRFAYVSSLAGELVRSGLSDMSGTAQRSLLRILHAIVLHCMSTNTNNRLVKGLLDDLEITLTTNHHGHVGSGSLWLEHWKHLESLRVIVEEADRKLLHSDDGDDDTSLKLQQLPPEMLHLILLRLCDHTDVSSAIRSFHQPLATPPSSPSLVSSLSSSPLSVSRFSTSPSFVSFSLSSSPSSISSLSTSPTQYNNSPNPDSSFTNVITTNQPMKIPQHNAYTCHSHQQPSNTAYQPSTHPDPVEEMYFKRLSMHNFPEPETWKEVMGKEGFKSWTRLYQKLVKRFKLPCSYSNCVMLCRHCGALFWKLEGHPCHFSSHRPSCTPVSPESFASLFATL